MTGERVDILALCEQIARLDIEVKRLERQAETIAIERDQLKAEIMQEVQNGSSFEDAHVGGRTIYVATVRRPYPLRTHEELVEALKKTDLAALVREDYNQNSLYSATNEWVKAASENVSRLAARALKTKDIIPEAWREALAADLSLEPKFEIRVRK